MKFGLLALSFVISSIASAQIETDLVQQANRQNPPGNYYQTCNSCDWNADGYFHCYCDPIQGPPRFTGLYYNDECPGDTLQNINGRLKCD